MASACPLMLMFLDFDGVLHPDAAYLLKGRPTLRADGQLFMWADHLDRALQPYPSVQIVLSTSWVRLLSFSRAQRFLPASLRHRVIGATWHSRMDQSAWSELTRYQQIRHYLGRQHGCAWLAIDDDAEGWPSAQSHCLIQTDPDAGLGDPSIREQLQQHLSRILGPT